MLQYILLSIATIAAAFSVILIKISTLHPVLLASFRQIVAALVLFPFFLHHLQRKSRKDGVSAGKNIRNSFKPAILPGISLGAHFIFWIFGARMTAAANATLITNMLPMVQPLFVYLLCREKLTSRELAGTIIAMLGIILLAGGDLTLDRASFWGDMLCLGSLIFVALYLTLGRKLNRGEAIITYLFPLYLIGGLFCFVIGVFIESPFQAYTPEDIAAILGLGLVSTVIGHSIYNYSMRVLRPQTVSIFNLSQFIYAGIFAYFFFHEIPSWNFYAAAVPVIAGAIFIITRPRRTVGNIRQ